MFASDYCTGNCLLHGKPVTVTCYRNGKATINNVEPKGPNEEDICLILAEAAIAFARRDKKSVV